MGQKRGEGGWPEEERRIGGSRKRREEEIGDRCDGGRRGGENR